MAPRLKEKYTGDVAQQVAKEFGVKNPMALPRLEKILLVVGLGKQLDGTKLKPKPKEQVLSDLNIIACQKPVMTIAKKSVSNFKVRAGYESGVMVTLRGDRMWEFFDRLLSLAIPRIKDFRGLNPKSFDGRGNYSFGVTEQGIFSPFEMRILFTSFTSSRSPSWLSEMVPKQAPVLSDTLIFLMAFSWTADSSL